jgi:hypothetical protein
VKNFIFAFPDAKIIYNVLLSQITSPEIKRFPEKIASINKMKKFN